jgi:N,N'-diacetyllegionaminate synthase
MFNNFFYDKFKIGKHIIGNRTFIIAEAGSNHNGDIKQALKLIDIAANSGADAVKFQLFKAENFIEETSKNFKFLQKYEFQYNWLKKLIKHCKKKNILFLASPFNKKAVDILMKAGVKAIKIASTETLNLDLVNYISKKKLPLFVSTGICNYADIYECLDVIKKNKNKRVALLQCSSVYPAKEFQVNLNVLDTYKNTFNFPIGFSDHSLGGTACIAAVSKGAKVIEKHFTLDCNMVGPDHSYAINPKDFKDMIKNIRSVEKMLGEKDKFPLAEELKWCRKKGIITRQNIKKNSKLSLNQMMLAKPQHGIEARYINIIDKLKIKKNKKKNEPIFWSDLE